MSPTARCPQCLERVYVLIDETLIPHERPVYDSANDRTDYLPCGGGGRSCVPQTRPSPARRRSNGPPDAGRMRDPDGHTVWFNGGARHHNPAWCGECLLKAKIREHNEGGTHADNETEPQGS